MVIEGVESRRFDDVGRQKVPRTYHTLTGTVATKLQTTASCSQFVTMSSEILTSVTKN